MEAATVPDFYYVETADGVAHAFRPAAMMATCGAWFGSGGRGANEPTCVPCGAEEEDQTLTENDWSDRADAIRAWMD